MLGVKIWLAILVVLLGLIAGPLRLLIAGTHWDLYPRGCFYNPYRCILKQVNVFMARMRIDVYVDRHYLWSFLSGPGALLITGVFIGGLGVAAGGWLVAGHYSFSFKNELGGYLSFLHNGLKEMDIQGLALDRCLFLLTLVKCFLPFGFIFSYGWLESFLLFGLLYAKETKGKNYIFELAEGNVKFGGCRKGAQKQLFSLYKKSKKGIANQSHLI